MPIHQKAIVRPASDKTTLEELMFQYENEHSFENVDIGGKIAAKNIGFILNTQWVASSHKTVHTVLVSYTALARHFESAMDNPDTKHDHSMFKGLHHKLTSNQFLSDYVLEKLTHCKSRRKCSTSNNNNNRINSLRQICTKIIMSIPP